MGPFASLATDSPIFNAVNVTSSRFQCELTGQSLLNGDGPDLRIQNL